MTADRTERPLENIVMSQRTYFDDEAPWDALETKDYRMGTLTIYESPKTRKKKPRYGFKFVETD